MPGRKQNVKSARRSHDAPSLESEIERCIAAALAEDLGQGDLTSSLAIPRKLPVEARIVAREAGVIAGVSIAAQVFRQVDSRTRVELRKRDGATVRRGDTVLIAKGEARALLAAERTALNFLQHLSGIASLTARIVGATRGRRVKVLATRKTTPGLRALQKFAVVAGGGSPHRQGLFDAILLKENHLDLAGKRPDALLREIQARVGKRMSIGAEARNLREALLLLEGGANWILLDNMTPATLRIVVPKLRARARTLGRRLELEASGGIEESNARAFASSGVDRISLGSLTHSVRALDLGMDFVSPRRRLRR